MVVVEYDDVDVADELFVRVMDVEGIVRAEYVVGDGVSPIHEFDIVTKIASGQLKIDENIEDHLIKMTSNQTDLIKVYLHAMSRRKIRRSTALVDMVESIQDELSKPYRIEDASTSELIRLLNVHTGEVNWMLEYLQDLVKGAQVEIAEKQFVDGAIHVHLHGDGEELDQTSRDRMRRIFSSVLKGVNEEVRVEDERLLEEGDQNKESK